jgi:hypothetical protein
VTLSPRERKVLAEMERDLRGRGPEPAEFTVDAVPLSWRGLLPVTGRHLTALIATLLALIAVHALFGGLPPAVSVALTAVLVVPWLLSAAGVLRVRFRARSAPHVGRGR